MTDSFDSRDIAPYAPARFRFYRRWADPDRVAYRVEVWEGGRKITVSGEVTHSLAGTFLRQWENLEWHEDSPFIKYFFSDVPGVLEGWRRVAWAANGCLGPAAGAK